jgi:hypothetical protein
MPEAGAFEPDEYSFGLSFDSVAAFTSLAAAAAAAITGNIGQHSCIACSQERESVKDHEGNGKNRKPQRHLGLQDTSL